MILTIDVGNSNVVLGGVKDDEILFEARLRTDATKTSDEYCIDLKMLLDVYGFSAKVPTNQSLAQSTLTPISPTPLPRRAYQIPSHQIAVYKS